MIREILRMGDARLLRVSAPVTDFGPALHELIADMFETMHAAQGAGLAAPQIGVRCGWWCLASSGCSATRTRRRCRQRC